MAVTEQDFLRIYKEKASYLLLRCNTHFHLVKVDAALSDSKYRKLLRLYPCDLQQLQDLGLHVSAFRTESLRHVIVEGYRAGDEIALWLGGDLRQYRLAEDCSEALLSGFFNGFPITLRSPAQWNGLDPKLVRCITWAVTFASFACSLAFLVIKKPYWLWSTLCILFQFVSILLIYLFPTSFILDDRKNAHLRKKNKRGNLLAALLMPSFVLAFGTNMDFTFIGNAFWPLFFISAVVYSAALLPLVIAGRNSRNRLVTSVAIVLLMIILGTGTIGQVNYLLNFSSADHQIAVVTDKKSERGILATTYDCTVAFIDQEQMTLNLSEKDYKQIQIGDSISVTYHDGLFHIPFYKISDS